MLKIARVFNFEGVSIDTPSHLEAAQFHEAWAAAEGRDVVAVPAALALLSGRVHGHDVDELPSLWVLRAAIAIAAYRCTGIEKKPVDSPQS